MYKRENTLGIVVVINKLEVVILYMRFKVICLCMNLIFLLRGSCFVFFF